MWILEHDGDLFQHKKTWLKPGHQYLFGRTRAETGSEPRSFGITNKSVSRKHLIIAVAPPKNGDGSLVHTKSTLTITDESKIGTFLDGEKLVKETRTLTKDQHVIRLGSYEEAFRITWKPVVLSFQISDKQQKASPDPLATYRTRLEPLDIKTVMPYISGSTTHVVAPKRNMPKCLQALVNGAYMVTEAFIGALERATASPGLAHDEITPLSSDLEGDFEASWPDALQYLPDPGKEPVHRGPEYFAPNPARREMFERYTFVFADQTQFETLQPVLTSGGAKALKFNMILGETTLQELVQYVRSVAEKKGIEEFGDTTQSKGVVVVRFRGKKDTEEWALNFLREMDQELDQRSIEQNEFLDAILTVDAAVLRRPLLEEETQGIRAPPSTAVPRQDLQQPSEPLTTTARNGHESPTRPAVPAPPTTRGRMRRTVVQSRFKGFDDFDDDKFVESQISRRGRRDTAEEEDMDDNGKEEAVSSAMQVDSQSLFVSESQPGATQRTTTSQTLGKRRASEMDEDNEAANMVDAMLPAAAAMKKRRLEDEAAGKTSTFRERSVDVESQPSKKSGKKRPPPQEMDVRSAAREHAESLDTKRSGREGSARQGAEGDEDAGLNSEVARMRDLAIIEEMGIRPRSWPDRVNDENAEGWDERWTGRKNFKKFVKAVKGSKQQPAATNGISNAARKIIVPLEEVKRKDFGIGDEYWLETPQKKNKKGRDSQGRSQTQSQRVAASQPQDIESHGLGSEESPLIPEEIAGQPREGPVAQALRDIEQRSTAETTASSSRSKRAAGTTIAEAPPAKKQKVTRGGTAARSRNVHEEEDESSDDELKFRFSRKR